MDVRHLRYFLGVVDHGGFGRAAAQLHVAQPSLSQAIAALERDLGVELFHRIGRTVTVSEPGRALIEPARRAVRGLDAVRAMAESLKGRLVGHVDLALMPSQSVEPFSTIALAFGKRYPGVTIRARAAFSGMETAELVASGASEIGLLGSAKFLPPAGVILEHIEEQDMVLVGIPGAPFLDNAVVHRRELAGQRMIVSPAGSVMRKVVDEIVAAGIDVDLAVEVEHRAAILPLVLVGGGLAVLPAAWTRLARLCGAAVMHLAPVVTLEVALAYREGQILTPSAKAFVAIVREYAANQDV
ncbi:LysR family transcriptional regulator [Cryobacterium sp. Y29]|uniref:LysR family transcriptional regulator n=1 Tax=Cryobacterium sp. Y29 TaxID=2048285 RepID=UPI000CE506B3|nr:LysR family transcriptional regulator [Cryobacterium sp. Y29]